MSASHSFISRRACPGASSLRRSVATRHAVAFSNLRQAILARAEPHPVLLWAFLDEGILYRPIGSEEITRRQLEHLIEMSERDNVTIQLLPYLAMSTTGLGGSFTLLPIDGEPDAAYIEGTLYGQIRDQGEELEMLKRRLEKMRAEVYPQRTSIELIRKRLAEEWIWS
ncbi:DUF5753 domain-containing protein [Nonomuraea sp. NPDC050786]|uniref:DUF5753 domain-containing protein n=1 Tax=Nonomuraea sp. NPDC050786 TaxID=3154840 RepID=UPI0033ECFAA8